MRGFVTAFVVAAAALFSTLADAQQRGLYTATLPGRQLAFEIPVVGRHDWENVRPDKPAWLALSTHVRSWHTIRFSTNGTRRAITLLYCSTPTRSV